MATIIKTLSSLFCVVSLLSLIFSTNQIISQSDHSYMETFCNPFSDNFTQTSTYQLNRETLLSALRMRSTLGTFANATVGVAPDIVRGMFLCRGDISKTSCSECVLTATLEIAQNCTHQKKATIYYEECMVRYSDSSFSGLVEERPSIIRYYLTGAPNSATFGQTLADKMDELIIRASSSPSYFAEDEERVSQLEGSFDLDSMVQCSPDLDPGNCTVCLKLAVQKVVDCCKAFNLVQIFLPKCLLRYAATALSSSPPLPFSSPPPPSTPRSRVPTEPPSSPPSLSPSKPPPHPRLLLPPLVTPGEKNGSFSKGIEIFLRIFIAIVIFYFLALLGL